MKLLEVQYQEARFYMESLSRRKMVFLCHDCRHCSIMYPGRAYVMEVIRKKKG